MLFEILGVFAGYYTRKWKKIAIILGMSFFFGLIGGFLSYFSHQGWTSMITFILVPIPVSMIFLKQTILEEGMVGMVSPLLKILFTAILSTVFTFVYYLIGKFTKWLLNKRGL